MPEIRPTSQNLPRDWRDAWSAFQRLRSIGRALGEPIETWHLEHPSTARKIVDRRWTVSYTFQGKSYKSYLGINGATSVRTLNDISKGFATILEARRAAHKANPPRAKKPERERDPLYDDTIVSKLWSDWQLLIGKIRSSQDLRAFQRDHPDLNRFMRRKAGILDMHMSEYLNNHPHARYGWITPPKTREEYDRRQRSFEEMVRREESRKFYD